MHACVTVHSHIPQKGRTPEKSNVMNAAAGIGQVAACAPSGPRASMVEAARVRKKRVVQRDGDIVDVPGDWLASSIDSRLSKLDCELCDLKDNFGSIYLPRAQTKVRAHEAVAADDCCSAALETEAGTRCSIECSCHHQLNVACRLVMARAAGGSIQCWYCPFRQLYF